MGDTGELYAALESFNRLFSPVGNFAMLLPSCNTFHYFKTNQSTRLPNIREESHFLESSVWYILTLSLSLCIPLIEIFDRPIYIPDDIDEPGVGSFAISSFRLLQSLGNIFNA